MDKNKLHVKAILLGSISVGKTSIINMIRKNYFIPNEDPTIGVSFYNIIKNGINVNIWDTSGSSRYEALMPMYYRNSNIIILVYSFSDSESLDRILYYLKTFYDSIIYDNCKFIIVGNKIDNIHNNEEIINNYKEQIMKSVKKYNYTSNTTLCEISCKEEINFDTFQNILFDYSKEKYEEMIKEYNENNKIIDKYHIDNTNKETNKCRC